MDMFESSLVDLKHSTDFLECFDKALMKHHLYIGTPIMIDCGFEYTELFIYLYSYLKLHVDRVTLI